MIALDSSVLIAALSGWHPAHEVSRLAMAADERALPSHAAFETVSALSRMPEGYRSAPAAVLNAIERAFAGRWLTLEADAIRACLTQAVAAGIRGGALYDALVAATATVHGATLLSADRRASAAYEALGARVQYLQVGS